MVYNTKKVLYYRHVSYENKAKIKKCLFFVSERKERERKDKHDADKK